jgi:hypothetical protein
VNSKKKKTVNANSLLTERLELENKIKAVIVDQDIKKQIAQIEEEIEKRVFRRLLIL